MVTARAPRAVAIKLDADLIEPARPALVQARSATLTVDTVPNTPQEFDAFICSEIAFRDNVMVDAGIRPGLLGNSASASAQLRHHP